jgi:hypothetical protein
MRKVLFFLFLLTAALAVSTETKAHNTPVEIQHIPPAVQNTWQNLMSTVYMDLFGRYGITTWYIDKGVFASITVFRQGSTFIRLFMHFTPQGELLDAGTDL